MSTLKTNKSSDIYRFGNAISMITEAGFLGFVPLMLLGFNILSCFQEASLVSQVIPNIQGSYWKALLYTGIALGAGIMFAPNFVWWRQIAKEMKRVQAKGELSGKYEKDYIANLWSGWWKYLFTWIICIATSIVTHSLTLSFTTTAFNNVEVLKMMSMRGMEDVSVTFCQVVTFSCFFLDILLGLFTNAVVDLEPYKPDNAGDLIHLKEVESYNEIQQRQIDTRLRLLRTQLEQAKSQNEADALEKQIKDAIKNKTMPDSSATSTGVSGSNPPGNEVPKDGKGKKVYDMNDVDEIYGLLFKDRGLNKKKIHDAITRTNQEKFAKDIAPKIAKITPILKNLYRAKEVETDQQKRITIQGKITTQLDLILVEFKKMGIHPKKKKV